ncbi:hypothetical protein ABZZ36_03500 [Actinacidiphila glaucinigra]|uniref:hypothetical protein n=1 Tax=Actinacidiphila glaucinigra TaxID=235986 RepID=UPI0033A9B53A
MRDEREAGVREADRAWRLLAELAARAPGAVRLAPGADDAEVAAWGVPLPHEVRHLVGRVRSIRIGDLEEYRLAPERGLHPGGWAVGPPGTAHLLHESGGDTLFVDVDGDTGAWGRVFAATGVFLDTWAYVAPSLVDWVTLLARAGLAALDRMAPVAGRESGPGPVSLPERADEMVPEHAAVLERLAETSHVFSYRPDVRGTPVGRARPEADPELAAVLTGLPDDALVVDLREVAHPATLHLPCPPGLRGHVEFQRRAGGRFAVGLPRTGQTSRSTTTGAWSEAPLPLRSSRST